MHRIRPDIDGVHQPPAGRGENEIDRSAKRVGEAEEVSAPLESLTRLGHQTQGPPGAPGRRRIPPRHLEHDGRGAGVHLAVATAHDAGHRHRADAVRHHRHGRIERPIDAVKGEQPLPRAGQAGQEPAVAEPSAVERVERLAQLEHRVVGDVDHVVDGSLAHGLEPPREPRGRRPYRHALDDRGGKPPTGRARFDRHFDAGRERAGRRQRPTRSHHFADGLTGRGRISARNGRQPEWHLERRGQFPGHALVPEEVASHRRDIEDQLIVVDPEDREDRGARGRVRLERVEPVVIGAKAEFVGRTEHPLGDFAPELPLFEGQADRQRDPDRRERVLGA